MLYIYVAVAEKERRMIPIGTKALARPRRTASSLAARMKRALRPVIEQIRADGTTDANAIAIAVELNRKRIATPTGGKRHAQTVIRVLGRLEATL